MPEAHFQQDAPPVPPPGLRYAAEHGGLVLFIGAGVSRLCGSPSWDQFADSVFAQLLSSGAVTYAELEQLKTIRDPRKKLSIAADIASVPEVKLNYDAILHPTTQHPDGVSVYGSLAAIGSVFVTTNYDKWLDEATVPAVNMRQGHADVSKAQQPPKRASYHEPETLTVEKLEMPGTVLHLHGSYLNPRRMVITTSDYIRHYGNPYIQSFLRDLFQKKTVLFIGYGLEELEVLEYIVGRNQSQRSEGEANHYILFPTMSHQHVLSKHLRRYFESHCGVNVIEYKIDKVGHSQLCDVLRDWSSVLQVKAPAYIDKLSLIDEALRAT